MRKAFYAGSFDPFTLGHLYVVSEALCSGYDEVIIGIGKNYNKTSIFSSAEKMDMIKKSFEDLLSMAELFKGVSFVVAKSIMYAAYIIKKNPVCIKIVEYEGMTVDAAIKNKADVLIRGVRSNFEREEERRLSRVNNALFEIRGVVCPTVLIDASTAAVAHISSTAVRNLMEAGEYILVKSYVMPRVHDILCKMYLKGVYNKITGETKGYEYICQEAEKDGFQRFSSTACDLNMLSIYRMHAPKNEMSEKIYDLAVFWSALVRKDNVDEKAKALLKDIVDDFSYFAELCDATNGISNGEKKFDLLHDICMNHLIYGNNCLPNLWQRWQVCKDRNVSKTEFLTITKAYDEKFMADDSFFKTNYFREKYGKYVKVNFESEFKVIEALLNNE